MTRHYILYIEPTIFVLCKSNNNIPIGSDKNEIFFFSDGKYLDIPTKRLNFAS